MGLNMTNIGLTVSGTIVGGVTLNPVILGCISGPGILIQRYLSNSDISSLINMCRFAYTSYQKIMIELKSYFRGMSYDEEEF